MTDILAPMLGKSAKTATSSGTRATNRREKDGSAESKAELRFGTFMTKALGADAADSTQTTDSKDTAPPSSRKKGRCSFCNKKVGFLGIECRCGSMFCSLHRYPDQHKCSFDFKTHDRNTLKESVVGGGEFQKIDKL